MTSEWAWDPSPEKWLAFEIRPTDTGVIVQHVRPSQATAAAAGTQATVQKSNQASAQKNMKVCLSVKPSIFICWTGNFTCHLASDCSPPKWLHFENRMRETVITIHQVWPVQSRVLRRVVNSSVGKAESACIKRISFAPEYFPKYSIVRLEN